MIRSMTGFGRFEIVKDEKKFTVEIKSVNHKYLDVNVRIPRSLGAFETRVRTLLKEYAFRGKVDIFISYEDMSQGSHTLKYNPGLAAEYLTFYRTIGQTFSLPDDIGIFSVAKSPEVLILEDAGVDEDELWSILEEALTEAFCAFRKSRELEGESLRINIIEKLEDIGKNVDFIETKVPDIIGEYKLKLTERVKDLIESGHIDDGRIAAEVTIYADKTAVDEEVVRLRTHVSHMKDILERGGDVGRNLDFIAQEMNREANTILSKSNDIEITNCGIELKTCIEKIREQVQNIE